MARVAAMATRLLGVVLALCCISECVGQTYRSQIYHDPECTKPVFGMESTLTMKGPTCMVNNAWSLPESVPSNDVSMMLDCGWNVTRMIWLLKTTNDCTGRAAMQNGHQGSGMFDNAQYKNLVEGNCAEWSKDTHDGFKGSSMTIYQKVFKTDENGVETAGFDASHILTCVKRRDRAGSIHAAPALLAISALTMFMARF
eukprot:gnl/TRDRNA2_/TRDRNA2_191945_c0_seq1.p1 gnl/TRDRNA2_/TRDRNA2_191945_c0~~gnl/TRDRNA2_/TRDRNA2_191945_c0_seq1.p1  ORF type:complete len:212 (+),score=28.46 gnl/TRDRNA2_/TRDRNA2_191945_c0_seq1:40-636(+)